MKYSAVYNPDTLEITLCLDTFRLIRFSNPPADWQILRMLRSASSYDWEMVDENVWQSTARLNPADWVLVVGAPPFFQPALPGLQDWHALESFQPDCYER